MAGGVNRDWLGDRLLGAPADLADRVRRGQPGDDAGRLAAAGGEALEAAISLGAGRAAALDLLAADALITLALLRAGVEDPGGLERFAISLRREWGGVR